MRVLSVILTSSLLICSVGCRSFPTVERKTNDLGEEYNVESREYAEAKEWGKVLSWALTMFVLYQQAESE